MKGKIKIMLGITMLTILSCFFALNAEGQNRLLEISELGNEIPIGQGDEAYKDWIFTNPFGLWTVSVSEQIVYNSEYDTNKWGGSYPWSDPMVFDAYSQYEYFLATNGMKYIGIFNNMNIGSKSDIFMTSLVTAVMAGIDYLIFAIDVKLGHMDTVETNSFYDLPINNLTVVIPIKDLLCFELQCGIKGSRPSQYSCLYTNGVNKTPFGTTELGDKYGHCVDQSGTLIALNRRYAYPTERRRFKIVTEQGTAEFTQDGDRLRPARIKIADGKVQILTTRGSDIVIWRNNGDVTKAERTKVCTKSWAENSTGIVEFPIDYTSTIVTYNVEYN